VPRLAIDDEAEKPVHGDHPCDLIKRHRLEHPVRTEQEWRGRSREQGNRLQPQRAAQPAHIQARERHQETAQQ